MAVRAAWAATLSVASSVAARSIRLDLDQNLAAVWGRGHVSLGELWSFYCRYPYLTRLRDRPVLDDGVRSTLHAITWQLDGFALADRYNEATGRYEGLVLPGGDAHYGQITDATLLVAPEAATRQVEKEHPAPVGPDQPNPGPGPSGEPGRAPTVVRPSNTRFFGVYRVDPERYGRDLTRLSQEILQQLTAVSDVELEVTVEVHARRPGGFPDEKVRVVLENARTLRFSQLSFEDD